MAQPKIKVLMVEDDPNDVELLSRELKENGLLKYISLEVIGKVSDLVRLITTGNYDLLITNHDLKHTCLDNVEPQIIDDLIQSGKITPDRIITTSTTSDFQEVLRERHGIVGINKNKAGSLSHAVRKKIEELGIPIAA